jgi:transcriptional regulator with XRE-family HTH domain
VNLAEAPRVKKIGEVLREARLEAGLSLRDLSKLTGMASGELSQIETGRRRVDPAFSVVMRVARSLGVDLGALEKRLEGHDVRTLVDERAKTLVRQLRELQTASDEAASAAKRIQTVAAAITPSKSKRTVRKT